MEKTTLLPPGYRILLGHPTVPEYLALRRLAGLTPKTTAQASIAITGSWYACFIVYSAASAASDANSAAEPSSVLPTKDGMEVEQQIERGEDEVAVAMARVIGDGGWYFHIVDMAVLPSHQQKGLGVALMENMLHEIKTRAPPGAYVNLIGSMTGKKLYSKFGFVETAPANVGMHLMMKYVEGQGPKDEIVEGDSHESN